MISTDSMLHIIGAVGTIIAAIVGIAISVVWLTRATRENSRRRYSPLVELLEPRLHEHGLNLLSASVPHEGDTGPFPIPGSTVSHVPSSIAGSCMWQFRTVRFADRQGRPHQAWARLYFSGGEVEIDWLPPLPRIQASQ